MNKIYQLQRERAGRFTGVTNAMMALLFVLGLGQMAICFNSATNIVANGSQLVSSVAPAPVQTNSTPLHGLTPASHQKI